ncbi:hypothetical protein [Frigoribacterium sp. UYMn621]|uniref:hypothetical protein n=1 Tax=Frigoribacterium sp. UYMn621 TaxID=3156343 RepID=UPI0033954783
MTINNATEIAGILDAWASGSITEAERDAAINAIATRGQQTRLAEIAFHPADKDVA